MPFPIMNVPPKDGQPVSHVLNIYQVWTLVSKKSNTWLPVHQFALNKKTIEYHSGIVAATDAVVLLIANILMIHVIVKQNRDLDSSKGVWM